MFAGQPVFAESPRPATQETQTASAEATTSSAGVYRFSFTSIDGKALPLYNFKGKMLLIVNTASQCGFASQYESLQKLYAKYKDKGLVVLAVPSNNFGGQEPGTEKEIQQFASEKFHVTFPMTAKTEVTGDDAHPFFKYVKAELGMMASPKWNFYKYLIGKDGKIIDYYPSTTDPMSGDITTILDHELK